jgi:manganese/zinc/iron transport system substrate-binding protein
MVADIARQVAGPQATVEGLMGEGVDPHLYKPTRNDVAKILDADVVFYSGLLLEGRMTDTFIKAAQTGKPIHAVTELIDESYLLEPPGFGGHHDPHVWMDVSAWSHAVQAVANALSAFDPASAALYEENAQDYRQHLAQLDEYARTVIQSIPEERRVLITAHDAFNYFGRAYGIEVLGIQGISTESEAGLNDINRLVDLIVNRRIAAVFVESSVSDKNVQALVEGARSRGHNISIGGRLFSDAMGPAGTYEGTYIGMIDHNATTITTALGGNAPQRGMNGKLSAKK